MMVAGYLPRNANFDASGLGEAVVGAAGAYVEFGIFDDVFIV
jgi:hypothetical protein